MKQTIQLGVLSSGNIFIAFVIQWYILTTLGPGVETDALFAGMTIPQLVLAVISGSLMHVLVPLLAGENDDLLKHDAWTFLVLIGGLFASLAAFLYILARWWVPLTVPGFNESGLLLTIELTRIQLIGMIFSAINGVQFAAYHARQRFLWAEFVPLLIGFFALLSLIWSLPRFGVVAAAWVSMGRIVAQTLLLCPILGVPVWPDLKGAAVGQAWLRIKPLLLGALYYKTDPLIDRFLLSMAGSGNLSLYYLAEQIYGAFNQLINRAIAVPLVPMLSRSYKRGDNLGFRNSYHRKLLQVSLVCLFVIIIIALCGQRVLSLLIGYGNISTGNIKELWWIMIWLGGMFLGRGAGQISSTTFYASGDTVTPTRIGMVTYTIYVPIKIATFYFWGVQGLAISTSTFAMLNVFLHVYVLNRRFLY